MYKLCKKAKERFNELNTDTSSELDDNLFNSYAMAVCHQPANGKISLSQQQVNDTYFRIFKLDKKQT